MAALEIGLVCKHIRLKLRLVILQPISTKSTFYFFLLRLFTDGEEVFGELSFPLKNFPKKANGANNIHQNLSNLASKPVLAKAYKPNDPATNPPIPAAEILSPGL